MAHQPPPSVCFLNAQKQPLPLKFLTTFLLFALSVLPGIANPPSTHLATFEADVTIPLGHPCMGGGITPARRVAQPLQAKGLILMQANTLPLVIVSVDWCEIRGSAFQEWKQILAQEAGTDPSRVLVTSTHVHDAPVMDPEAEFILRDTERGGAWKNLPPPDPKASIQMASVCWPDFNRIVLARVRETVRASFAGAVPITEIGTGRAKVDRIASNRRFLLPDGRVSYARYSRSARNPEAAEAGEGDIDPWLRTLSFWNGDKCVCEFHTYAVHPMSSYGAGEVSIDFVGLAREERQKVRPEVFQIYATGCAGNVTAGKYNDGTAKSREVLTARLATAMEAAFQSTQRRSISPVQIRHGSIALGARATKGYTREELQQRLLGSSSPFARAEAAMGLAWYDLADKGHRIDLPAIELGNVRILLFPAESYVEYALYAQDLSPDNFVISLGYGECGPGYIPIERAWTESDQNLRDWAWVGPGSEEPMRRAIREALGIKDK